jgi:DNA-directed RNA polymerase subunit M/transcription elongation factor TFIIS
MAYAVDAREYNGPLLPIVAYEKGCARILRMLLAMLACSRHKQFAELSEERRWHIITQIEDGVWNYTSKPLARYQTKFTFILFNMASPYFVGLLIGMSDEALAGVATMKEADMNPEKTQHIRDAILLQLDKKVEMKIIKTMPCPACKQRNATIILSAQIRASDEGRTIRLKCNMVDCNAEWNLAN